MSDTIDRLDIAIEAQASNAIAEVDKLYASLERVANILNTASGAFGNMKTAVQGTSRALRSMAKITLPNLTTMTQQLQDLSQINLGNMGLGQNINITADSFKVLETTSDEAGKSMSALTPIVKGIETAFKGLGNIVQGVASHVGKVATFMVSNFTMIGRAATGLGKIRGLLSGILGPLIGFYGVRSLVTLAKDAVGLASDLTEVQNVVDHAFGLEGAKAVETFVETSKEQFGLAELAAKQYASRFQAMGKSMEVTTDMVAKAHDNVRDHMVEAYRDTGDEMSAMALNLTKLTADMASFYNEDQSKVAQALQSVYTGQTRSLRQYGIDLTQVNLQEWAHKQGIEAKMDAMTQAEKAMLRYQYIMAQTSMVQGDFARTADTWANQIRLLKQNFQALGSTIGNVVINAFKPLITWLNAAMTKVIAFAETIANALGKIFGWTIRGEAGGGGDAGMGELESGLDGVGDAADGAGGSLGKANDKAKELKRTLLGFDEINKLNEPTDSSSGSGGSGGGSGGSGGSGGGGGASAGDFSLVKTETIFDKFDSDIQSLFGLGKKISDTLSTAMEQIDWQSVYEKARDFGTGLAHFLNGLISPRLFKNLGTTIAGSINAVLNAKDAFLNQFNFKNLGYSLAAGIMGFFETWDAGLTAKVFYKTVNGIVDTLWAALDGIGEEGWSFIGTKISSCVRDAIKGIEWKTKVYPAAEEFGTDLAEFMNGLFNPSTFSAVGDTIAKFLNTELRTLSAWARKFEWDSFGRSLAAGLKRFLFSFDWNLAASTFTKLAKGIITAAEEAIDNFASGNGFYVLGRKISAAIRSIPWDTLLASAGRVLWKAFNGAIDIAKGMFSNTPFEDVISGLQTTLNKLAGKIDFPTISKGIKDIVDALAPAVSGFAAGFVQVFDGLADIGIIVLNGIGLALNVIADAIKKMPPEVVKSTGKALGIVAGSLAAMKIATGVSGIVSGFAKTLGILGGSGAGAATGVEKVATAVEGTSEVVGGSILGKLKSLGGWFLMNAGVSAQFTEAIEHTFSVDKNNAYLGLTNALFSLYTNQTLSKNEWAELEKYMGSAELKGMNMSETAYALGKKLGELGVDTSKLTQNEEAMNRVMGTFIKEGGDKQNILDNLKKGVSEVNSAGGQASSTGFNGLLNTLLGLGDNADDAEKKAGIMKSGIWAFAAGVAGQALLMTVMGGAFKGIGDKADSSKSLVAGFATTISTAVSDIKKESATAKTSGEEITKGTATGMCDSISMSELDKANQAVSNKITGGTRMLMAIKSPSQVMAGIGENITLGLAQGISAKSADALTSMSTILTDMLSKISGRYKDFNSYGKTVASKFAKGVGDASIPDLGSKVKISSTYWAHNMHNPVYEAGVKIANAFKAALSSVTASLDYRVYGFKSIKVGDKSERMDLWKAAWYASGGFPNYGEVFVANERGPEMVGRFGTKNVVANNQQITEGIERAVVSGMMKAAMSGAFGNNDGTPVVLNAVIKTPDGDVLARVVEKAQARRDARYRLTTVG